MHAFRGGGRGGAKNPHDNLKVNTHRCALPTPVPQNIWKGIARAHTHTHTHTYTQPTEAIYHQRVQSIFLVSP